MTPCIQKTPRKAPQEYKPVPSSSSPLHFSLFWIIEFCRVWINLSYIRDILEGVFCTFFGKHPEDLSWSYIPIYVNWPCLAMEKRLSKYSRAHTVIQITTKLNNLFPVPLATFPQKSAHSFSSFFVKGR